MEYVPMCMMGLLGGAYLVCSLAELVLSLLDLYRAARTQSDRAAVGARESNAGTPAITSPAAPAGLSPSGEKVPEHGILIAAGHRRYRGQLERWFRERGFTVWAAADGQQAVEVHRAHRNDIAVAVLDLYLPGLDGPRVLAALRSEAPSLRCCVMAAGLGQGAKEALLAAGAAGVFEKPLLLPEAEAVIRQLLRADGDGGRPGGGRKGVCSRPEGPDG